MSYQENRSKVSETKRKNSEENKVKEETIDLGINIAGLLLEGMSAAVAGLTLGLKSWVDAGVARQDKKAYEDWRDVIDLHAEKLNDMAAANGIVSLFQESPGDNNCICIVVAESGGLGWLDAVTNRAYWHKENNFPVLRVRMGYVQIPGAIGPAMLRIKSIPGKYIGNMA